MTTNTTRLSAVPRSLLHAAGITSSPETAETGGTGLARALILPLVRLQPGRGTRPAAYAASTVNDRGRLADRTAVKTLHWTAGAAITIAPIPNQGIVIVAAGGTDTVTPEGHLRLSAEVRHASRIQAGDKLMVAAYPTDSVIVIYTPHALDAMISAFLTTLTTDPP